VVPLLQVLEPKKNGSFTKQPWGDFFGIFRLDISQRSVSVLSRRRRFRQPTGWMADEAASDFLVADVGAQSRSLFPESSVAARIVEQQERPFPRHAGPYRAHVVGSAERSDGLVFGDGEC